MLKLLIFVLLINYAYSSFLSYGLDGNNKILGATLLEPEICFSFDDCFDTICGMINHKNSTIDKYSVLAGVGVDNLTNDCPYNYTHDYVTHMLIYKRNKPEHIKYCHKWSCVVDLVCEYENDVGIKGFCF